MFEILKKYTKLGSVMSASGAKEGHGLHKGHAYSILNVIVKNKFRLVKVRNPWGSGEWTGDWSDKSSLWAAHPWVAKACAFVDAADGAFWMSYEDFSENFSWVGICDRSIDADNLEYKVLGERTHLGPAKGCAKGCCIFWCTCEGYRRIYFPKKSEKETVEIPKRCCACLCP